MYPGKYAAETPAKAAAVDAVTGETLTYKQLDEQSAQLARYLRSVGLQRGDALALNLDNRLEFFVGTWASKSSCSKIARVAWRAARSPAQLESLR